MARLRKSLAGRAFARFLLLSCWVLAVSLSSWRAASVASAAETEADPEPAEADIAEPTSANGVVSGLAAIEQDADDTRKRIASLGTTETIRSEFDEHEAVLAAFGDELAGHGAEETGRPWLGPLLERLLVQRGELASAIDRIGEDLGALGDIEARWKKREAHWDELRKTLRASPQWLEIRPSVASARQQIGDVLEAVGPVSAELVIIQQRALALRSRNEDLTARIRRLRDEDQRERLRRNSETLLSRQFLEGLVDVGAAQRRAAAAWAVPSGFFARIRSLLVIHLLAIGLVWFAVRRLARSAGTSPLQWRPVMRRSLALAVFLPTTIFANMYLPAPGPVEALLWLALGAAGVRLITAALTSGSTRRAAVIAAAGYPTLVLVETLGTPVAWLRLAITLSALALMVWFGVNRRRIVSPLLSSGYLGASLVSGFVVATEAVGFEALARFVFVASLRTGFVIVGAVITLRFLRGMIDVLLVFGDRKTGGRWHRVVAGLGTRFGRLMQAIAVLVSVLYVANDWELIPPPLEAITWFTGLGFHVLSLEITVAKLLAAAFAIVLATQLAWVFETGLEGVLSRRGEDDEGLIHSVQTLVRYAVIVTGFLLALGLAGISLSSLAIVAGALGVGIGFGLQHVASDFFSGLILLFERQLRTGDSLVINGEWATIRQIGLRSTQMVLLDESELVVPNSHLTSEKVRNYTLTSRVYRVFCPVGVAYGSNLDRVFATLQSVAKCDPNVLTNPPPEVLFLEFGDSTLNFELRAWIPSSIGRLVARSNLLRAIDTQFHEQGIEIAFPQRDLHVRTIDSGVLEGIGRRAVPPSSMASAEPPRASDDEADPSA